MMVFIGLFVLSGCTGSRLYLQRFNDTASVNACSVGVLPFLNRSSYGQGDKLLYRVLLSRLVEQGAWRLALEGDVLKIYQELRLRPWHQPSPEQMQIIASRLGVDILVAGEIFEMKEQVQGDRVNPRLKMQLQVYNGKDGTRLWATYNGKQGTDYRKVMHFGLSTSVSQLANIMMKDILELWEEKGVVVCSD